MLSRQPGWGALGLLILAGAASAQGEDPAVLMAQLEARALAARKVVVEAQIEAQGAVAARLQAQGELLERNRATLTYAGDFRGSAIDLRWTADGRTVLAREGERVQQAAVARASNRALLLGVLRMGLVQPLARLAELPPPAAPDAERIVLDGFRPTTYAMGGDLDGAMSFGFDLVVDGEVAGQVRLWLDAASGLPRRRLVTMRVGAGEMTVREDYRRFALE